MISWFEAAAAAAAPLRRLPASQKQESQKPADETEADQVSDCCCGHLVHLNIYKP